MQPDRRFVWRAEAPAQNPGTAVAPGPRRRSIRHSCRVLVVDDDVLIRAQLCALLHGSDYDVETAASGEDALRLLRSYPCDIVVTDWQMPLMDGVTLCRRVRSMEQHEHVYMLMLTVRKSPRELLAGLASGADDYVVKGTSSEELLARLEKGRCLANWRAAYRSNDDDAGDLSLTDAATGAYNLAYLMQHLPREIARAERYGRSFAVLNCEINGVARVNAQFAGDELLRRFASCSTGCIRKGDWLARTGAREFMIALPETDRKGAECVARKLSEAFTCQESPTTKEPVGYTINIHVTAMDAQGDGDGTAHMRALLRKAESHGNRDKQDATPAPDARLHYLSDLVSVGDADRGRNWPAT
jgi:two-component system, cell cycle response regulator